VTILIVEDDPTLGVTLRDHFQDAGMNVLRATDGQEGLRLAFEEKVDLILLDVMLPKVDGFEICRTLRTEKIPTPILMLTAKGQVDDVVHGLELGADDYLVKTFSLRELDARVKVLARRIDGGQTTYHFAGEGELDTSSRAVRIEGQEVALTPKEFDLLAVFLRKAGRALTRDQLLGEVWGHGLLVTTRSVDRCVKTLREKLGPHRAKSLVAVRGVGYRWDQ
jgi:two-component system alkaline phosphatase synthesis response regulator PhoP